MTLARSSRRPCRARRVPARVPRGVLRLAGRRDPGPRAATPRRARPRPDRGRRSTDPGAPPRRAGSPSGRPRSRPSLTLAIGLPVAVGAQPVPLPRPGRWSGAGHGAVRRCRPWSWRPPSVRSASTGRSLIAILLAHCLLQRRGRRARRRRAWTALDPATEEAARMLGAGPIRTFVAVTLPALRPAIVAAGVHRLPVLLHVVRGDPGPRRPGSRHSRPRSTGRPRSCWTCGPRPRSRWCSWSPSSWPSLVAGASGVPRADQRASAPERRRLGRLRELRLARRWSRSRAGGPCSSALPILELGPPVARTRRRGVPALGTVPTRRPRVRRCDAIGRHCVIVADRDRVAIRCRSALAVATAVARLAAAAGLDADHRGRWSVLPLGVSAVTVGFGFLIVFDTPPLDLRTSWWIIPIAHALVALPFVVRATVPTLRSIDPRLREAAAVLGAAPVRVWREVDLPVVAARGRRRGRVRVRDLARRVRRDPVHRPTRNHDRRPSRSSGSSAGPAPPTSTRRWPSQRS